MIRKAGIKDLDAGFREAGRIICFAKPLKRD